MKKSEKTARRLVRQANGLSPGFRYFDDPYEGMTMVCPRCGNSIPAGLETCPECGGPIPGQHRSREPVKKSPLTLFMIAALLVLLGLGLYFFIRKMIESGFPGLLLGL